MVIVSAKITTTAGKRDAFVKAAQDAIASTRKENGCICYELYASTENENLLMYYEQWMTRDALEKHMKSDHMKAFAKVKAEQNLQVGDAEIGIFDTPDV